MLWMVSHPELIFYVDGWYPILVTAPEIQEEEVNYNIYSSMFTLLSGAARDPGHGTRNARGGGEL